MLFDQPFKSWEKRLALDMQPSPGRALLHALLTEWNYTILPAPTASDLLLIEAGRLPPPICGACLWLTPKASAAADHLPLPLPVEDLWRQLEGRFHVPARAHIRITLDLPASVHRQYQTHETRMISLSDMGCRFLYHRELAPEEEIVLHLPEAETTLPGKVIYSMERGDLGTDIREIGLLFQRPDTEVRRRLRELIVAAYLSRVRARMAEGPFWAGLDFFRIAPAISRRLLRFTPAPAE